MKKLTASIFAAALAIYFTASAYIVTSQGIQSLLVCANSGGLAIPFSKNICRSYLFNMRGSPEDIAELQEYGGAALVINQGPVTTQTRETLEFLVSRGLDVNRFDESGIRPLQGAVLENSFPKVELLLDLGADPTLKGRTIEPNSLELAVGLKPSRKTERGSDQIISILREASNTNRSEP